MRELSIQEKRNLNDNLAHCSDDYRKFYNGYLEVNKELGFKCNGADTYDHFDWYVAAIKIGTLIECYNITNPKTTKLIRNIDEYREFMKKHIELQKKQIVKDRIKELSEDFE
jgi:hypothetical protein